MKEDFLALFEFTLGAITVAVAALLFTSLAIVMLPVIFVFNLVRKGRN